jgi:hypothetical protein
MADIDNRDARFLNSEDAILVSAIASFHTNDDNKDWDSVLTITIERGPDQFAKVDSIMGEFPDHSDSQPFAINVQGTVSKGALRGATTTLKMVANGNDTWRFNYFLDLVYNDGSRQAWSWFGNELRENRNIKSFQM